MYLQRAEANAASDEEQRLLEITDDRAVVDAILDKSRKDPTRSKHNRALDTDEWRKAHARALSR